MQHTNSTKYGKMKLFLSDKPSSMVYNCQNVKKYSLDHFISSEMLGYLKDLTYICSGILLNIFI